MAGRLLLGAAGCALMAAHWWLPPAVAVRGLVLAVVARVDVDAVARRVDVDAVIARVDLDAIILRLDVPALARRTIDAIDLPEIVRESSGILASETVRGARAEYVRADDAVDRFVDRILRRRPPSP